MAPKVIVLHGPNLNLLGIREPDVYGSQTLQDIDDELEQLAMQFGVELKIVQSNHEGELVDVSADSKFVRAMEDCNKKTLFSLDRHRDRVRLLTVFIK